MQCNTYLRRTKMTFQTLEYILNGIVHANITAVHCYKTATALIHKLRKIMTANDAKWQSTQCKSRFSLANYYHSAFHTLIFWIESGSRHRICTMPNWIRAQDAHCAYALRRAIKRTQREPECLMCEIELEYFFSSWNLHTKEQLGVHTAQSIPSWCCRRLSFAYSYVITS